MIFYSPSTNGFYEEKFYPKESMPSDSVEITPEDRVGLLAACTAGKIISVVDGKVVATDRMRPTQSESIERIKAEIRAKRRDILDAVTGIGLRANVAGDMELAKEASYISQQLLDITDDDDLNSAITYEEMRAAGVAAYRRIAASASPAFAATFKEFTGA